MNRLRLRGLVMVAVTCAAWGAAGLLRAETAAPGRLLVKIDCTAELPPEKYFGQGDVRVVDSPLGRYREAEGKPLSRFGYRFPIENVGKPHLVVVRYPDDKRRFMCMMDGTCYDLTTGVFTDFSQPLSGKMLEIRQVFWPRWKDCSVVLMTWSNGEPAAAAQIEVYELDDLPALALPNQPGSGPRREFGIQYEDPCGRGASEGAISAQEWLDRVVAFAKHSGQNLLAYPIVWYHGPFYPSQREPSGEFGTVVAPDRRQYAVWTSQPAEWVAPILERFAQEGLGFQAALTLLRLGSLMERMNVDLDAIKAGKDTFNNVLASNHVQAGTQDWTTLYNVLNFQPKVEGRLTQWAYGEKDGQPYPARPMFNPVHPVVQEAILGLVQEIVDRYGKYPAFKGISFNMWHATILWWACLDTGYDDYTVGLFEKETGIATKIDPKAPDRFSQRFTLLTGQYRDAWIAWRCRKIHELFGKMRDIVVRARPDLRLTVTLWTETTMPKLVGMPNSPAQQLYARPSTVELFRQGGFDVDLFRNEPGIEIDYTFEPERDRDGWGTAGVDTPLEAMCMFRDHDYLDSATLSALGGGRKPGVMVFNSWVEAWGDHKWFPCEADDTQAPGLAVLDGKPAEGIFRINSEYPKDGFWWNSQLRITPPFPAGIHFLESFAHAVAELDACRITSGGLFLDTAHADEMRRFALAYRALPAEKFETVGERTDPVAVRTLVRDGRRYLYLVNRDYYPVAVELTLASDAGRATDLATGQEVEAPARWAMTLGPYELRSFSLSEQAKVVSFQTQSPEEIVRQLKAEADAALAAVNRLRAAGQPLPPGAEALAAGIGKAIEEGRLAWARRALGSYAMRKVVEKHE
jgi:hypothetical protein